MFVFCFFSISIIACSSNFKSAPFHTIDGFSKVISQKKAVVIGEVDYDIYDKIHIWRICIVFCCCLLVFYLFIKIMAIKCYQVVSTRQTICFYPRNFSFLAHMVLCPLQKTAPKDIKKCFCPKSVYWTAP